MKLNAQISIQPPQYSDHNNKIISLQQIVLNELNVTYCDDETRQVYYAKIDKIPNSVILFSGDDYSKNSPINKQIGENKLRETLTDDPTKFLRSLFPKTMEENPNGPGSMLSNMIKKIGIVMTQGCSCRRHAIEMNEKGNNWCEENIDTIVKWLREEAEKRRLPFFDSVGKLMIYRAIKKSRKLLANESVPDNDEDLDNL